MEKMTYVKALDVAIATLSADQSEVKEKLEALKASIAKKNSAERKPTATQTANEGYKSAILSAMESGKGYTQGCARDCRTDEPACFRYRPADGRSGRGFP